MFLGKMKHIAQVVKLPVSLLVGSNILFYVVSLQDIRSALIERLLEFTTCSHFQSPPACFAGSRPQMMPRSYCKSYYPTI